jgi:hypothetical protein
VLFAFVSRRRLSGPPQSYMNEIVVHYSFQIYFQDESWWLFYVINILIDFSLSMADGLEVQHVQ